MSKFTFKPQEEGFTLVELMIVVAIIGLLAAVAVPNFKKYQAKAKTSEAKIQLASLYTAETSFYSDYDHFGSCLAVMGYDPSAEVSQRYYAIGFSADAAANGLATINGAPTACSGTGAVHTTGASSANTRLFAAGKKVGGVNLTTVNTATVAADGASFTAMALGAIDAAKTTTATADQWTVNENKRIQNQVIGY